MSSNVVCKHTHTGEYWVQRSPGYPVKVYCDMERVCGCDGGGGWMRVADRRCTVTWRGCVGVMGEEGG